MAWKLTIRHKRWWRGPASYVCHGGACGWIDLGVVVKPLAA